MRSGERAVIAAIPFAKTSDFIKNQVQWLDKFRTVTGVREDLYYGSDTSTFPANSGTVIQAIISPKGNLILSPWQNTEYYLSVGQGLYSNDLRGALTTVDALATEINFQQGNPTTVIQQKTQLLTKATGYELGVRSEPFPDLRVEAALFVLNLDSEATFSGDQAVTTPGRPSHRQGIELSASYKPLPWLRLDGDFAASRVRFANIDPGTNDTEPGHPGNYIPNVDFPMLKLETFLSGVSGFRQRDNILRRVISAQSCCAGESAAPGVADRAAIGLYHRRDARASEVTRWMTVR